MKRCRLFGFYLNVFSLLLLMIGCDKDLVPFYPPQDRPYYPLDLVVWGNTLAVTSTDHNHKYQKGGVLFVDISQIDEQLAQSTSGIILPRVQQVYVPIASASPLFLGGTDNFIVLSRFESQMSILSKKGENWQDPQNIFLPGDNPNFLLLDTESNQGLIAYQTSYISAPKASGESGAEIRYLGELQGFTWGKNQEGQAEITLQGRVSFADIIEANNQMLRRELRKRVAEDSFLPDNTNNDSDLLELDYSLKQRNNIVLAGIRFVTKNGKKYLAVAANSFLPGALATRTESRTRLIFIEWEKVRRYVEETPKEKIGQVDSKDAFVFNISEQTLFSEVSGMVVEEDNNSLFLLLTRNKQGALAQISLDNLEAPEENYLLQMRTACGDPKDLLGMTTHSGSKRLFVTCYGGNLVVSYERNRLAKTGSSSFNGRGPTKIVAKKDETGKATHLFVSNNKDGSIGVYDPETLQFRGRLFEQSPYNRMGG